MSSPHERPRPRREQAADGAAGALRPHQRPGAEPIIQFRNVRKAFGRQVVYEDLSLDVFPGETLTIIGGSGQGKSVMLKLLIGLLRADGGSIQAFGQEVTTLAERDLLHLRSKVAMLFQGAALFDSMSVEENIKYPLIEHGWGTAAEMDQRVDEVLHMVDMPGVQKKKPSELSGGMRKRVGLARAIAIQPEVILYDEPTTGLDPINVRRINGLILSLQQRLGVTSVVVTHDMDTVFTVTDRLAMVYEKRIAFAGTPEEARNAELRYLREFVQGGWGTLDEDL
ncbi:MAG: ATP-binding cassette domain-containing protein [Deltaproteobacteria bacterium]|jgi:phospholipid/cholesterol/gamma-HCH transport system ATP-binding protein|nr:ATP-binding cassette domain-containing protein [Deltaproteobacteria bacterium]